MSASLSDLISARARVWADAEKSNPRSAAGDVFRRINDAGKLREPQIRAIEVYLWLKFPGENRRLADLVLSGALAEEKSPQPAREFLADFARANNLRELEMAALRASEGGIAPGLREMLRDLPYSNYLFSLPMGAGKTWLMSAFICLDLHFSRLLPGDPRFARNFVVLAPHAAKTAILPSLKTIRDFDPEWVLPSAAADEIRREQRIEILDSPAAAKRDTRVNNPNLEKVNRLAHGNPRGLVFITNAEKVVLEKHESGAEYQARMGARKLATMEKINELRERMAGIPALAVFLDESHHTYAGNDGEEKKLRKAVDVLRKKRNLTTVLGFSGTPYVKTKAEVCGVTVNIPRLQDVVYDFPLARGIGEFLKKPKVFGLNDVRESAFIRKALDDFFAEYDREYADGTKSKIAFYCPSVAALNETILPVVKQWFAKNRKGREGEIFAFYASDKEYPLPKNARAEFHNLDSPRSEKRVVLLVAVGKEGWDCRSLTAVALPRENSSQNFVLQSACRCLREVQKAADETALILLGEGNYVILNEQLKKTHDMTIQELEDGKGDTVPIRARKPKLGTLKFKQVRRKLTVESQKTTSNPEKQLQKFSFTTVQEARYYDPRVQEATITQKGGLRGGAVRAAKSGGDPFLSPVESFPDFLMELSRALWGTWSAVDLTRAHGPQLRKIHAEFAENREWLANHPEGGAEVCRDALRRVAACFAVAREWKSEHITTDAEIQLLEWRDGRGDIPWASGKFLPEFKRHDMRGYRLHPHRLDEDFDVQSPDPNDISFNYIPYRFDSDFEVNAIRAMLAAPFLSELELYYNGMISGNLQSFQIQTPVGIYTPDFLLLKRRGGQAYRGGDQKPAPIERVLIIETKGKPYNNDDFQARKEFVEGAFSRYNPNFRYVFCLDKNGRNEFQLAKLEQQVKEWAAGEELT